MNTIEPDPRVRDLCRGEVRRAVLVALAILIVYVLAHLALLWRFPWFVDETYFATRDQAVLGDPSQRFVALVDHKGLILSWLGAFLIKLDLAPVTAVRLISVVSGVVAAIATGWVMWQWRASVRTALIAAALASFVPYMFVHDAVGILDPFVAAGSMVALGLEVALARRARLDLGLLLGMTLGVLLLSKPTGEIAVALIPLGLVLFDWRRQYLVRRLAAWAGLMVLAVLIALCMYALTRLSPLGYTPDIQNHRTLGDLFSDPFGNWDLVASDAWHAIWGYLTPPGVVLAVWGLVRVLVTRDRLGIVIAAWGLAALAAFVLLTDNAFPRYGLQLAAPACLLMIEGGVDLWSRARRLVDVRFVALLAGLACIPMLLLDGRVLLHPGDAPYPGLDRNQYVVLQSNESPVREAAKAILRRAPVRFPASTPVADRSIAQLGGWGWVTMLTVNGDRYTATPRFIYLDLTSDQTQVDHARFVIVDGSPPAWLELRRARLLGQWPRPGGGATVKLYERRS